MKVYFDGSARPNPGLIQTVVVAGGRTFHRADHGQGDNSEAEWLAAIEALAIAGKLGIADVIVLGDARLVIAQARGTARRIAPRFAVHLERWCALVSRFERVRLRHIGRAQNLAGIALERINATH